MKEAQELLDVTLACEDETIDVHKVLLSASSPFFRNVLMKTKQNNPFIYMKGIKFEYLKRIVDFIYNGEAFIAAKDLDKFLEAAQELEITGLATDEDGQNETSEEMTDNRTKKKPLPEKTKSKSKEKFKVKQEKIEQVVIPMENQDADKEKEDEVTIPMENQNAEQINEDEITISLENEEDDSKTHILKQDVKINIDDETIRELTKEIEKNMETVENSAGHKMIKCKFCGKELKKKSKASDHIETHLDQFSFPCEFCSKSLTTRKGLKSHIVYNHTQRNKE